METLQDGHDVVEQLLSSNVAPAVFGLALLIAGQLSTFTGTIAGQVVLEVRSHSLFNKHMSEEHDLIPILATGIFGHENATMAPETGHSIHCNRSCIMSASFLWE